MENKTCSSHHQPVYNYIYIKTYTYLHVWRTSEYLAYLRHLRHGWLPTGIPALDPSIATQSTCKELNSWVHRSFSRGKSCPAAGRIGGCLEDGSLVHLDENPRSTIAATYGTSRFIPRISPTSWIALFPKVRIGKIRNHAILPWILEWHQQWIVQEKPWMLITFHTNSPSCNLVHNKGLLCANCDN